MDKTIPISDVISRVINTEDSVILIMDRGSQSEGYEPNYAERAMLTNVLFGNEAMIRVRKSDYNGDDIHIETLLYNGYVRKEQIRAVNPSIHPITCYIENDLNISLVKD